MDHEFFMHQALQEAYKAFDEGEVPVGAVIVKENCIIGRGYNRIEALNDATAHAEIIAIGAAAASLKTWRLNDCTIYITLEPCLMCLGGILQSRIGTIVYGATDSRYGAVTTSTYQKTIENAYSRFPSIISSILESECKNTLQMFFKTIRKKN